MNEPISPDATVVTLTRNAFGTYTATNADGASLDKHFAAMGGWISSTLVRLGRYGGGRGCVRGRPWRHCV